MCFIERCFKYCNSFVPAIITSAVFLRVPLTKQVNFPLYFTLGLSTVRMEVTIYSFAPFMVLTLLLKSTSEFSWYQVTLSASMIGLPSTTHVKAVLSLDSICVCSTTILDMESSLSERS